jgi:hypothetical protein
MSGAPQFASSINSAAVAVATANANRDGTGVIATLFTAGVAGSRIDEISVKATVTTTAGMLRFFLHDGVNFFLWRELLVGAVVPSGTVASFEAVLGNLGLLIEPGWTLRVSTQNAENFNVMVTKGGDF